MRLNLCLAREDARNGYVNVDPARGNLDGVVEQGEATEVVALNVLDWFGPKVQPDILRHWCSRLAPGGTVVISCTDLYEVARAMVSGNLREADAVKVLYGDPAGARKATLHSELSLAEELRSLGLEIVSGRTDELTCVVTAKRPA